MPTRQSDKMRCSFGAYLPHRYRSFPTMPQVQTPLSGLTVANGETFAWGTRTYVMGIINVTPVESVTVEIPSVPFPRISYCDAIEIVKAGGGDIEWGDDIESHHCDICLLYTSPSPRD